VRGRHEGSEASRARETVIDKGKKVLGRKEGADLAKQKLAQNRKANSRWLWVRKGTLPDSIPTLGFQASVVDVWRFGSATRKLVPVKPSKCDECSFAEVVKEGAMSRDAGNAVVDLRQGSWGEDETRFKNRQEWESFGA
jgi:hypothetical protein